MDKEEEPADDILTLKGVDAYEAGFGINLGLGYAEIGMD